MFSAKIIGSESKTEILLFDFFAVTNVRVFLIVFFGSIVVAH